MTRVVVLGVSGMLGHKLYQRLPATMEVTGVARQLQPALKAFVREGGSLVDGFVAGDAATVIRLFEQTRPDVVINCVGINRQREEGTDAVACITANSLFPHQLAAACADGRARLIHVSTDCVFSGARGGRSESDSPDPVDLYGLTKLLGEVDRPDVLTIRTSMIGRELSGFRGLLEWFLRQRGVVRGYTNAIFSGLTTLAVTAELARVITVYPRLSGIYHLAVEPIAKYDLLHLLRERLELRCEIVRDGSVRVDRSLNGSKYSLATGYVPPGWSAMIEDLAEDMAGYPPPGYHEG